MKDINETRNYLFEKIKQNDLMSRKHKKTCTILNYIGQFLILASAIARCISISAFASLIGIPIGNTSSAIRLKFCVEVLIFKTLTDSNISHDEFVLVNNVLK